MKKVCIAMLLWIGIFASSRQASCAEISAEQHVKNFYIWYINESDKPKGPSNDILDDDTIYTYVDHCVAQNIRILYLRYYWDADYFTKSQDIWKEWLDVFVVHPATKINDTTSIVPISFVFSQDKQHHLVVFVQHTNNTYRITKVIGTDSATE